MQPSAIPVVFYRTAGGTEPVRDWLKALPIDDRRRLGQDLGDVQYGWPVGMPLCRSLGAGLWELRSNLPSRRKIDPCEDRLLRCGDGFSAIAAALEYPR